MASSLQNEAAQTGGIVVQVRFKKYSRRRTMSRRTFIGESRRRGG
jgi:hypothetical protein